MNKIEAEIDGIEDIEGLESLIDQLTLRKGAFQGWQENVLKSDTTRDRSSKRNPNWADDQALASLSATIHNHSQPCFLVDHTDRVLISNGSAKAVLDLHGNDDVDDLGIKCLDGDLIKEKIESTLKNGLSFDSIKVGFDEQDSLFTLFIVPLYDGESGKQMSLLFAHSVTWGNEPLRKFVETHGLTDAENKVLFDFVSGLSLQEISTAHQVSITTTRSQFYAVLQKFGVNSQSELIKEIYSVSDFLSSAKPMFEKSQHPFRRAVNVLRPGGRVVDVTLAGDFQGAPIVVLTGSTLRAFSSTMEDAFRRYGIFAISVSRPALGETTKEPEGTDYYDCVSDDVAAVLDQLGYSDCVIFSANGGFRCSVEIASRMPHRVRHIIAHNVTFPSSYSSQVKTAKNFLTQLEVAFAGPKFLRRKLIQSAARAAALSGTKRILKLVFRHNKQALQEMLQPHVFDEIDAALKAVLAQGIAASVEDYERNFADWFELIRQTETPISWVEREDMPLSSKESAERFGIEYADRIRVLIFDGPQASMMHSAPDFFCRLLLDCYGKSLGNQLDYTHPEIQPRPLSSS